MPALAGAAHVRPPRWRPPPRSSGRPAVGSTRIGANPSCRSSWAGSSGTANPHPAGSTSSCGWRVGLRWLGCRPRALPTPRGHHHPAWLVLKHDPHPHLHPSGPMPRPGSSRSISSPTGSRTEGFYLCTLCALDIPTAWVELEPVWGKGRARVGGAVHRVRTRPPPAAHRARQRQRLRVSSTAPCWPIVASIASPSRAAASGEERQCPRRAEERRRRPPARRL
jgi:hypothetical protein